jgi:hypothetical protein
MTDREILAQKIHYRGASFTGRDLFDFAVVTRLRPELREDAGLVQIGKGRKAAIMARLDLEDLRAAYEAVQVHPQAPDHPSFEEARNSMQTWLASEFGPDAGPKRAGESPGEP